MENDYFEPGQVYEVWTPIEAPAVAQVLLDLLTAEEASVVFYLSAKPIGHQ